MRLKTSLPFRPLPVVSVLAVDQNFGSSSPTAKEILVRVRLRVVKVGHGLVKSREGRLESLLALT